MRKLPFLLLTLILAAVLYAQQTLPSRDGAAQIENASGSLKFSVSTAGVGTITPSGTDLIIAGALKPTTALGVAYGGTGSATGAGTLGSLTVTNHIAGGSLAVVTNVTIGGTLAVTGTSSFTGAATLATVTVTNHTSSGSLAVVTNATVGGTLAVTGTSSHAGAATFGSVTVTNASVFTGSVAVGGGTAFLKILTASATLDFPSIVAQSTTNLTITVTGADTNSVVMIGLPAGFEGGLGATGFVSSTNTVSIIVVNPTVGAIDPASAAFRATVINY